MSRGTDYKLAIRIAGSVDPSVQASAQKASGLLSTIVKGDLIASGIKTATSAMADFATSAFNTYKDFDQSLMNAAAGAGASAEQFKQMEKAAREAGAATSFSAAQAADAMGYMALAGWSVDASTKALTPVLQLAEATQKDLAQTADQVTNSMSAMGLGIDDLNEYLDVLITVGDAANTDADQLMTGFIRAGGAARAAGLDYKQTSIALAVLANNGIKGAEAGTAMNAIFNRMTAQKKAQETYAELGVRIYDAQGQVRDFQTIMEETSVALEKLNDKQRNAALAALAGTEYFGQYSFLLESVKKGADGTGSAWDSLADKIGGSDGSLVAKNKKIMDTLQGALSRYESALDEAQLSFFDTFGPDMTKLLDWVSTNVMPGVSAAAQTVGRAIRTAGYYFIEFGQWAADAGARIKAAFGDEATAVIEWVAENILPGLSSSAQGVSDTLKDAAESALQFAEWLGDSGARLQELRNWLQENKTALEVAAIAVTALTASFVAYKAAAIAATIATKAELAVIWLYCTAVDAAAFATKAFSAAMAFLTSPVTLVIGAIAALVAAGAFLYNNWDTLSAKGMALANALSAKFPWMASIIEGVVKNCSNIFGGLRDMFGGIVTFVKGVFAGDWSKAWQGIVDAFGGIWGTISGVIKAPINAAISLINTAISGINSINVSIPGWVPGVGGKSFGINVPQIPLLAEGGIVTQPTLAMVGEGGESEAVIPLSKLPEITGGDSIGRLTEAINGAGNNVSEINFSPTINVTGSASKSEVQQAVGESFEQFKQFMAQYEHERRRRAFS